MKIFRLSIFVSLKERRKQLIISFATLSGIILAAFFFFQAFWQGSSREAWLDWIYVGAAILIIGVTVAISMLLLCSRLWFLLLWVLGLLPFLLFFGLDLYLFAALGIFFLCLYFGFRMHLIEERTRLKIQIFWILSRSLPMVLTGICFLTAMIYFLSPSFGRFKFDVSVPSPVFNFTWQFISPQLEIKELGNAKIMEKQLGIKIPSEEEIKNQAYQKINKSIKVWLETMLGANKKEYLSVAVIFVIFLGLRTFGIPLMWLIIGLSWIILKLLLVFNIIKIGRVQAEKETLTL